MISWEYWLVIIIVLFTFFGFIVMSFFLKKFNKTEKNEYEAKASHRIKKAKYNEDILLNKYINCIEEVWKLLEDFDPIKNNIKMTQINEIASKKLKEIAALDNYKSINNHEESLINWELINKLETTKASNWKKFEKEIKTFVELKNK